MLKLFYAPHTCSLATHIALIDAGAEFETVRLSFKSGDQRKPEYLAVNPKARVPSLVTDDGILTETPALLAYVAQRFPAAKLAPLDDPFAFARVQAFNSYLCSTCHVAHAHRMRGTRWVDASETEAIAAMQRKVPQSVTQCFELIERDMLQGPFVMGEAYTICDPYLFTLSQWLEGDKADVSKLPRVIAHRARMAERANVQRAIKQELAEAVVA
jgi:glutathione S-transferase